MVAKFCSRSHGQPLPGVRSAAMMSISAGDVAREGMELGCGGCSTVAKAGAGTVSFEPYYGILQKPGPATEAEVVIR